MRKLQITLWIICLCLALFIGGRFLQTKRRKPPMTPLLPTTPPPTAPLPGGQPAPSPKLSPDQVIGVVLKALQTNDKKDSGIATTFRFASLGNRRFTGPLSHFIPMVKSPAYRPMLNFKRVARGKLQTNGDQAREQVTITAANGAKISYIFGLSKQKDPPYAGCWMTDSVAPVGFPFRPMPRPPVSSDIL